MTIGHSVSVGTRLLGHSGAGHSVVWALSLLGTRSLGHSVAWALGRLALSRSIVVAQVANFICPSLFQLIIGNYDYNLIFEDKF